MRIPLPIPASPRPSQPSDLLPRRRAALRKRPGILQPDDRQDGIAARHAETVTGQAVAEVRILLPHAGPAH